MARQARPPEGGTSGGAGSGSSRARSIERVSGAVDALIGPFATEGDLLTTIPGVDQSHRRGHHREIGLNITVFGTSARLASRAGMCPGQHECAGKSRSGRSRHGNTHLQKHLSVARPFHAQSGATWTAGSIVWAGRDVRGRHRIGGASRDSG
ncbi:transposase [Nostocoides sp.]